MSRRHSLVDVVFGDEVGGQGVEAAGEEGGEQEVNQGCWRSPANEGDVKDDLDHDVEIVNPGEGHTVNGHRTDSIEKYLEGAKEGFAEYGIKDESLERGREVSVEAIDAERLVMC